MSRKGQNKEQRLVLLVTQRLVLLVTQTGCTGHSKTGSTGHSKIGFIGHSKTGYTGHSKIGCTGHSEHQLHNNTLQPLQVQTIQGKILTLSPDTKRDPLELQWRMVISPLCKWGGSINSRSCSFQMAISPFCQPTATILRLGCQATLHTCVWLLIGLCWSFSPWITPNMQKVLRSVHWKNLKKLYLWKTDKEKISILDPSTPKFCLCPLWLTTNLITVIYHQFNY